MKKLILIISILLLTGCATNQDEISYSSNNQETKLTISHYNNGGRCTIIIKTAEEAKQYRERLQKVIKELDNFEKDLSIREKTN